MSLVTWEYRIEHDAAALNELGQSGWELVAVTVVDGIEQMYLKRPGPTFRELITLDQREEVARMAEAHSREGEEA
ncbi:DUF4177 domain-containing protein [Paenibacillus melissococcoides]|uniref:DUF4177 domain-containing protein n=1 Tax=Paenibacillus melissococcoides TaxID=2912268 RepID=A0ABM9G1E2_9BACL|nr:MULTISPECIES: hypothetical protein [Paenibacillus]MEB9893722.1 hypothetical protein [Bacillus cereus]CAH8245423.1 DUF4177 domain-containing protein [Paenibacillus melissococcoides]CAH8710901.1 DUF4177 domain-containing protein [Paenibacillus melissococcoides]CAH8711702.1 DUF4177 domain-containing protein [Paenibacillus melissococcoides]GIO77678.1 hypothetical protein J6TS7_12880 [Paenibacillus dendritiformis]